MSGWVKVGTDHRCVPEDWSSYPRDSLYQCPTCRRMWRVHGSVGGPSRSFRPDPFSEPYVWLTSPAALIVLALIAAVLVVAVLAG